MKLNNEELLVEPIRREVNGENLDMLNSVLGENRHDNFLEDTSDTVFTQGILVAKHEGCQCPHKLGDDVFFDKMNARQVQEDGKTYYIVNDKNLEEIPE